MLTNAESKILFAGWTWVTLGSNKLKEKTIYDEKQHVAITEQRQYDLLSNVISNSWSFGLLKSKYNVKQQIKSNKDKHSIYFCSISRWLSVSTFESSAVAFFQTITKVKWGKTLKCMITTDRKRFDPMQPLPPKLKEINKSTHTEIES